MTFQSDNDVMTTLDWNGNSLRLYVSSSESVAPGYQVFFYLYTQ